MAALGTAGSLTMEYHLFLEKYPLISRRVDKLRLHIDETFDEPGAGNPIDVCVLSPDPLHFYSFSR